MFPQVMRLSNVVVAAPTGCGKTVVGFWRPVHFHLPSYPTTGTVPWKSGGQKQSVLAVRWGLAPLSSHHNRMVNFRFWNWQSYDFWCKINAERLSIFPQSKPYGNCDTMFSWKTNCSRLLNISDCSPSLAKPATSAWKIGRPSLRKG